MAATASRFSGSAAHRRRASALRAAPLVTAALWLATALSLGQTTRVYVSNEGNGTVTAVNSIDNSVAATIAVGAMPGIPAATIDGARLYVPNRGSSTVSVIDVATDSVVATIAHPSLNQPQSVAIARGGQEAWIINRAGGPPGNGSITIVDTATNSVIEVVTNAAFSTPVHLAVDEARDRAYLVNNGNGTLTFLVVSSRLVFATVSVGTGSSFAAVSPSGDAVYVANAASLAKMTVTTRAVFPVSISGSPRQMVVDAPTNRLFFTLQNNQIGALSFESDAVTTVNFADPALSSYGVAIQPGTGRGYVSDQSGNQLVGFDAVALTETTGDGLPVGGLSTPRAVAAAGTLALADLSLAVSDSPDPVQSGLLLTYSFIIANLGPSPAGAVVFTNALPAGIDFVSAAASQGTCSLEGSTVECDVGAISEGATVQIDVETIPSVAGTIANTADVSVAGSDPNPSNNMATATTVVTAAADLSISVTDEPDPALVGQPLNFRVTVVNNGPVVAERVRLFNRIPAGSALNSVSAGLSNCITAQSSVTCNLESLARGASSTVDIQVTPTAPGIARDDANVGSVIPDPNPSNNEAFSVTNVEQVRADVSVVKTASTPLANSGSMLRYNFSISNLGPDTAPGVRLVDVLPEGVRLVSTEADQGAICEESAGQVACAFGNLPSNASREAALVVGIDAAAPAFLANTGRVSSLGEDPDASNNASSALVRVVARGDVNGDGQMDAADIQALILEINDGDGDDAGQAQQGSFAGNATMDLNGDGLIDFGDLEILYRLVFAEPQG